MKTIDKIFAAVLTLFVCFVVPRVATVADSWVIRILFSGLFFWAVIRPVYFFFYQNFFNHDDL